MWLHSFSCVNIIHIYIHTLISNCLLESEDDRHTHIHSCILTLDFACTSTHTSRSTSLFSTSRSVFVTYTHKKLSAGHLIDDDRRRCTRPYLGLVTCAHTHIHHRLHYFFKLTGAFPLQSSCVLISPVWDESS